MSFRSIYCHGFARVAACTTRTALADPATNAQTILTMARECDRQAVAVAVFPELGLSGYAISDLLQQAALLNAVETAIDTLVDASAELMPLLVVGAPLRHLGALYNCALAIHRGACSVLSPKSTCPTTANSTNPAISSAATAPMAAP